MGIFNFSGGTALEKGNKLANKKRFSEAIPYLVQAVELNQQPAFAAKKLGLCYQFIGKLTDAEKSFELAVQLNPANVQGWVMCSVVQSLQGRFLDAETTAEQGLSYSVSENQELDCCLSILQALMMQIEAVGYHRCAGERPLIDYRSELDSFSSARIALVARTLPILDRCRRLAPSNPDLHRFNAFIALYDYDLTSLINSMQTLQRLYPSVCEELKVEFRRCYGREIPATIVANKPPVLAMIQAQESSDWAAMPLHELEVAAKAGDPEAQTELGLRYQSGIGAAPSACGRRAGAAGGIGVQLHQGKIAGGCHASGSFPAVARALPEARPAPADCGLSEEVSGFADSRR